MAAGIQPTLGLTHYSHEYEVGIPQEEERWQGPERLVDVSVVPARLWYGGAQLSIA